MENRNNEMFAAQADKYAKENYWRYDEEYLVNKYFKPGNSLLVLGVGGGRTLPHLHKKGLKITAIDIVPEMVEKAKENYGNLDIPILEMDATDLKFKDGSFDCVFFPFHGMDCIYPDIYKCVKEAARVLKPDGVLIFNSHNRFSFTALKKFFPENTPITTEFFCTGRLSAKYLNLKNISKALNLDLGFQCFP